MPSSPSEFDRGGTLLRGPNGELYFIPDDLGVYRVPDTDTVPEELRTALDGLATGHGAGALVATGPGEVAVGDVTIGKATSGAMIGVRRTLSEDPDDVAMGKATFSPIA